MTRSAMLQALQADVDDWPQRVKRAGVRNAAGVAYVPVPRNNEILRTPHEPETTYRYMIDTWRSVDAETGSEGWYRIIAQAGPELTWEWLMVDPDKPYAKLFPTQLRERVRRALESDAGYAVWVKRRRHAASEGEDRVRRIERAREDMRAGRRPRLEMPELDHGLRSAFA